MAVAQQLVVVAAVGSSSGLRQRVVAVATDEGGNCGGTLTRRVLGTILKVGQPPPTFHLWEMGCFW